MSLHDAMKPNNEEEVLRLVNLGEDVNAKCSGLSVIQHAADQYSRDIGNVGSATAEAQKLRAGWKSTITPLVNTGKVRIPKVTKGAWNCTGYSGLPPAMDISVDPMLHHLGIQRSEIAEERGYRCYF